MKAFEEKLERNFVPVHLVLETQEEVDKVYALFNHSKLVETLGMFKWHEKLQQFKTQSIHHYHVLLRGMIP